MSDDARVQQLLDKLLDSQATPEVVCETCPELLPVVRDRWLEMRRLRAELDALFPPSGGLPSRPPDGTLPQVPGYQVEAVLGRGGMGIVFRAKHLRLNRTVALKMSLAGGDCEPRDQERFRREAEAVAALRHPNIAQVYDAGEADGRAYFTMELVEGGSLAQKIAGTPQPARQSAELLATLAAAVQAAHSCGIVHRDLKPANVLLALDGTPKVSDFGLARRLGDGSALTQTGAVVGTPSYMAPEQAGGRPGEVGPAADVYALGAILYELLTGRAPFKGETAAETVHQVVFQDPLRPSLLIPRVPRDLETICLKCLHKDPARRYASAQDLADDLRRFLDGKPIRARPVGMSERAAKWVRRRPAAAVLVAALLVLMGTAVGVGFWLRQQETDRQTAKARREGQAREALGTALRRADDLRREERWGEALAVLADASPNVTEANDPNLEQRFRQTQSDFQVAAELERVRESSPLLADGNIDYRQRAADFRKAFEHAGLSIDGDVESVVDFIRASAIGTQLIAAVEDRALVAHMLDDGPLVERLLRIARSAEPEPLWRDRFRTPAAWKSRPQLLQLAGAAFETSPQPSEHELALLALLLRKTGSPSEGSRLLGEACRRRPKNFWVHREMGVALALEGRFVDAAAFYRIAVTLRPENADALAGLGTVLARGGQTEDALAAYRRAVELSPKSASLHTRLVEGLANAGYWEEAEAACRRALEVDPANPHPPFRLAEVLYRYKRVEDAMIQCRKAVEIAPQLEEAHYTLGELLAQAGRHEDAVNSFRKVTTLRATKPPPGVVKAARFPADLRLAQELAAAGRGAEAIAVLDAAAARDPKDFRLPLEAGKLYRSQGKLEDAAESFDKAATLLPSRSWALEELAAARLDQGRFADARAAAERLAAIPGRPEERRAWRRQLDLCDSLLAIDADLPAILAGKERPADAATQRALAEWCLKHKRLTAAAAGFYEAAFSARPSLADDLEAADRADAARAVALAGCGVGEDVASISAESRATLRKLALVRLTADYNAWAERHRVGKPGDRTAAAAAARSWQKNEDLAAVRDEQGLAKLPADERRAWQALWAKVAALAVNDPVAMFEQARSHVTRREWEKAAKCYAEGMELEPTDNDEIWFEYAAAQLLAGDEPGHRRACAQMLARSQGRPPSRLYLVARACTLAPAVTDDPARPSGLSANNLEIDDERNQVPGRVLTEQAALHVRAGRCEDAVPLLEQSLAADGRPGRAVLNWLWLALAHQQMGKRDEARRWLDKAARWLDQQGGRMPLESPEMGSDRHNWLEAHVLRKEVEARLR
jgi:serine/threonine-protein kinase